MKDYLPIVGMEIHVELKTNSKMFCGCKNDPFHAEKPNMYTCPVCLGMPGGLPVANKKAIEWTLMLGLALNCEISLFSKFDRKNYFYPDLSKGYQISQYDQPFCRGGFLEIPDSENTSKKIRIHRIHLEEDTGKLVHSNIDGKPVSLIDFNRCGVPLVEIVTEPDIHSSEDARIFLKKLHQIIRYLDISDAQMEKGSMRCEPNISVAKIGEFSTSSNNNYSSSKAEGRIEKLPPYKVEVKNINSFSFVKKAIDFEVPRHIAILENGQIPVQETRGWDEKKNVTVSQRKKEEAQDYRYFPDPDLPPMKWTADYIEELKNNLPELPDAKVMRFMADYAIPPVDAQRLTESKDLADYFEKAASKTDLKPKAIANWIINKKIDIEKVSVEELIKTISTTQAKVVIDPTELQKVIDQVISSNPKPVEEYKKGKVGVIMFLVGMAMKELKGKADAQEIKKVLEASLNS